MIEIYNMMLLKREKYVKAKDFSKIGYCDRWTNKLLVFATVLKDIVGVDAGYPLEDIMERNCIWELTGLTIPLQSWFINTKLFWKMEYKKANPEKIDRISINVFEKIT